jgi:hypothetical protein
MMLCISNHGKWVLENCVEISCDGTFASTPEPFKQIFFLMARMNNHCSAVPVAFVLLPDKQMSTYNIMMTELKKVVSFEAGIPERVMVDFERAFWNVISSALPWAKVIFSCLIYYVIRLLFLTNMRTNMGIK